MSRAPTAPPSGVGTLRSLVQSVEDPSLLAWRGSSASRKGACPALGASELHPELSTSVLSKPCWGLIAAVLICFCEIPPPPQPKYARLPRFISLPVPLTCPFQNYHLYPCPQPKTHPQSHHHPHPSTIPVPILISVPLPVTSTTTTPMPTPVSIPAAPSRPCWLLLQLTATDFQGF